MAENARNDHHRCGVFGAGIALLTWLLATAAPLSAEVLTYTLEPDFARGVLKVRLDWETGERKRSILSVSPQWGRIRNVSALLRDVRFAGATASSGGPTWELAHRERATIRVEYVVDPQHAAFDDWDYTHHPITTRKFFHGMGNAFLMAPANARGIPETFEVILRWKLPAGYDAACSWGVGRHVGAQIKSTDLRHSVYLAGDLTTKSVALESRRVTVAMVDAFKFDVNAFTEMTTKIIAGQCDFMVETKFPDFVVTAIPVGKPLQPGESRLSGSGLYNSFALFVAPQSGLTDAVEHLFAHELFHYWNGRILAAQDPERLVYWFVEGITDYYALRILYESGYWDAETYVKWLNRHLREYTLNPAIHATNEEIDKLYWEQRETVGEVAYQRGLLLGLRWHYLATSKGVRGGFDRLFQSLVDRARTGRFQLTNNEIRAAGNRLLGSWFSGEFDQYVQRAETVDVPPDALGPAIEGKATAIYEYELGFDRDRSLKGQRVIGLRAGGPAAAAGVREGDELVGWNLYADNDRQSRLIVQRGSKRESIRFYPRGARRAALQFSVKK